MISIFYLVRDEDDDIEPNKVIGEGVIFSDGKYVVRIFDYPKLLIFKSIIEFVAIFHSAKMVGKDAVECDELGFFRLKA